MLKKFIEHVIIPIREIILTDSREQPVNIQGGGLRFLLI